MTTHVILGLLYLGVLVARLDTLRVHGHGVRIEVTWLEASILMINVQVNREIEAEHQVPASGGLRILLVGQVVPVPRLFVVCNITKQELAGGVRRDEIGFQVWSRSFL